MDTSEGLSIAKMAVAVLLICLLISAVMFIWYFMYDGFDEQVAVWEKAAVTAAKDRLDDLVLQTDIAEANNKAVKYNDYSEFPLVTNVCNALDEFSDDGLIFVSIYYNDGVNDVNLIYTYDNVTPSMLGNPNALNPTIINSTTPVTAASCKLLYDFSGKRCKVEELMVTVDVNGNYIIGGTKDLIAYDIQILQ